VGIEEESDDDDDIERMGEDVEAEAFRESEVSVDFLVGE
jgi:hypothetical protein